MNSIVKFRINKKKLFLLVLFAISTSWSVLIAGKKSEAENNGIKSLVTNYTISKVRVAKGTETAYIVASSFEGTVVALSYEGNQLWENKLSGFMNHDLWCNDITGDGVDEILVANADGTVYCLSAMGKLLWSFKKNEAPFYAVTTLNKGDVTYVVAGGFDKRIYYLSKDGVLIKELKTENFSIEKPWGKGFKKTPKPNVSTVNFIRPLRRINGDEILVVLGTNNHMNVSGTLYFFNLLEDKPFKKVKLGKGGKFPKDFTIKPIGDFKIEDIDIDGNEDIILGTSAHTKDLLVLTYNLFRDNFHVNKMTKVKFGYDIAHTVVLKNKDELRYLTRVGNQMRLYAPNTSSNNYEEIRGKYSYNDMIKDPSTGNVILASSQSGGSCIHIIDTYHNNWISEFEKLEPKGKIAKIIDNTKAIQKKLSTYKKPEYQNNSQLVYLMSESVPESQQKLKEEIDKLYKNPIFLNSVFMRNVENFDRSGFSNEKYRNSRDKRKRYTLTQQEAVDFITKAYDKKPGISYWAGHGNDPFMFDINTTKKVLDKSNGKKTVLIYPEVEDHTKKNLDFLVNSLIYPLANYAKGKNANIFLRSKHIFWLGSNYLDSWSRLMSGEFADVILPSMEETTGKTMELSLAGRVGMWTSGAVNSWGTRVVPDNTSYDRSRQLGNQRLPNHFLRMLIFHTAYGAQFINNFPVKQDYLSIYWELIAKGVLYVPKRNEVLSISPVHISMKKPNPHYLEDGTNVKWTTFYNEQFEKNNPFVFSRLNGTWPGAVITKWDFSRYAAGVKERRLNFLAPYTNGLVLITPPQEGKYADKNAKRGMLKDNLHPMYKNILSEFITDGQNYYSKDGKETYQANDYYKVIEKKIKEKSSLLPVTVSGNVAWVVAQISPKHLRLTLVENGYINPKEAIASVKINHVKIVTLKDILTKEEFKINELSEVQVKIPLGGFRFLDLELSEKF